MDTDILAGAVPQKTIFKKTELKCGVGAHKGYWIGFGDKSEERNQDPCPSCGGEGVECKPCHGTGKKHTTKIALLWQLGPDQVEQEWVTFIVSAPGTTKGGKVKSASTLFNRLRVLSGGLTEPQAIREWVRDLQRPIKIPVELMVLEKENGDGTTIAQVRVIHPKGQKPAPPPPADDEEEPTF